MKMKKNVYLAELSVLIGLILLMAFTPLGYLKVGPLAITFIPIPMIVGAITLGAKAGATLGFVFGLTSLAQCFGLDPFGTALLAINPFFTALLCLLPRIITGFCTGLIAKAFQKKGVLRFIAPAMAGPLMNTLLFTSTLFVFFWNAPQIVSIRENSQSTSIFAFFFAFVGVNALVELTASTVISGAIAKAIDQINNKQAF